MRDNSRYEIEEQRPLAAEDVEAGILLDAIVCLGQYQGAKDRPDHPLRLEEDELLAHLAKLQKQDAQT
jgi:hypothetical protein